MYHLSPEEQRTDVSDRSAMMIEALAEAILVASDWVQMEKLCDAMRCVIFQRRKVLSAMFEQRSAAEKPRYVVVADTAQKVN